VALKLEINSWRWKGVPFYIRAGKCLPVTATEVVVKLRQPPAVFSALPPPPNYFRFRVTPDLVIAIGALVKKAGPELDGEPVEERRRSGVRVRAGDLGSTAGGRADRPRRRLVRSQDETIDSRRAVGRAGVAIGGRATRAQALVATRARRQLVHDMPMARMPAMLNTAIHVMIVRFSRGSQPRLAISQ
jgi:hypothetical protein